MSVPPSDFAAEISPRDIAENTFIFLSREYNGYNRSYSLRVCRNRPIKRRGHLFPAPEAKQRE